MSGHTQGKLHWELYSTSDEDVAFMRKHGMEPVRLLTNDGAVPIMADGKRIALIDCQSNFKRGTGHKSVCEERDANARRMVASWNALRHMAIADIEAMDGAK